MASASEGEQVAPDEQPAPTPTGPSNVAFLSFIALGVVLSALGGWLLIENVDDVFGIAPELANIDPTSATTEELQAQIKAIGVAKMKNTSLAMGLVGASLAALLAIAVGIALRSGRAVIGGFIVGLLLGAVGGALGGFLSVQLDHFANSQFGLDAIYRAMLGHCANWALIGFAVGLAVSVATGFRISVAKAPLAGLVAGVVSGLAFCPTASALAIAFPHAKPEQPLPTGDAIRFYWVALPALLIGVAMARVPRKPA